MNPQNDHEGKTVTGQFSPMENNLEKNEENVSKVSCSRNHCFVQMSEWIS
jgi:hypothetical protein